VARIAGELGFRDRSDISVLDIGGRDINGCLRDLFAASDWTTLDNVPAPEVDIVADARTWQPPRRWDLVLCTEVLEHVDNWQAVVATAASATSEGGALILTCASAGRPQHSQTGSADIPDGEHYGNVTSGELDAIMGVFFMSHRVEYAHLPGDVYAWGRHAPQAPTEVRIGPYGRIAQLFPQIENPDGKHWLVMDVRFGLVTGNILTDDDVAGWRRIAPEET
jgi:hypothetical protein